MNKDNWITGGILGAGLLCLVAATTASAYPDQSWDGPTTGPVRMLDHGGMGGRMGGGMEGHGNWHRMLHRLDLTDAQKDQIFKIFYAQMPDVHDKMMALHSNREALRDAITAPTFDAQKVRQLADTQGKLMADLIVDRAETFNKVYSILTPEQQKKISTLREGRHEGGRMHRHWRGSRPDGAPTNPQTNPPVNP